MSENSFELSRVILQSKLDAGKTSLERNELGQFATPKKLAGSIVGEAVKYLKDCNTIDFLEPSIGTGSFYSALLDSPVRAKINKAVGFEIDKHYALPSIELWSKTNLEYRIADFLSLNPPENSDEKFNLIVTNPPYVRHHHLKNGIKESLLSKVEHSFGIRFSGLSGLYCYFLALSARWLRVNGISVWLIPGEFLDVNYGVNVKEFLLHNVNLLRIHRFNPEAVQFNDALVTSVVVFYTTGKTVEDVLFTTGAEISEPASQLAVSPYMLNPKSKWSQYFFPLKQEQQSVKSVGDYFSVKRGIATGSNKHFILSEKQVIDLQIPSNCIRPILPSPRYVKTSIIEADFEGRPLAFESQYLLDIPYSEEKLELLPCKLKEYLQHTYLELKGNYLVSKRTPWYKQEKRSTCPFLMTYMSRNTSEPFRLLLNLSKAVVTNVFLMLYPKFDWQKLEKVQPGFLQRLHQELLNIKGATFISSGRVYGGGLFKLEPKELMNTPIDDILSYETLELIQSTTQETCQLSLFERSLCQVAF
jgi:hypothetical protein